jgi:death-on-curing protein
MKEPKWLTERMALAIHDEAVAMFGGLSGVRDAGLLSSALGRPQHVFAYEDGANLFRLAGALCVGIAKNHPFLDGNKRTALLSTRAFLFLNSQVLEPPEAEEVETMVGVAEGRIAEPALSEWLEQYATPKSRKRR